MSMIPVHTAALVRGKTPSAAVIEAASSALAGLGLDCQWDDFSQQFVGDCQNYGMTPTYQPPGGVPPNQQVNKGGSTAWDALIGIAKQTVGTFNQVQLNQNQAKVYQTTPTGMTVYQTSQLPNAAFTPAGGLVGGTPIAAGIGTAIGSTPWLLIGAGLFALFLLTGRSRGL